MRLDKDDRRYSESEQCGKKVTSMRNDKSALLQGQRREATKRRITQHVELISKPLPAAGTPSTEHDTAWNSREELAGRRRRRKPYSPEKKRPDSGLEGKQHGVQRSTAGANKPNF